MLFRSPVGYGLSYTSFALSDAVASCDAVTEQGMDITCRIKNTGAMAGAETVQVYVQALPEKEVANLPNHQLKGLAKVFLEPGEEKTVTVKLPAAAFGLYDEESRCVIHKGQFKIHVGTHGPDSRSCALCGTGVDTLTLTADRDIVLEG